MSKKFDTLILFEKDLVALMMLYRQNHTPLRFRMKLEGTNYKHGQQFVLKEPIKNVS